MAEASICAACGGDTVAGRRFCTYCTPLKLLLQAHRALVDMIEERDDVLRRVVHHATVPGDDEHYEECRLCGGVGVEHEQNCIVPELRALIRKKAEVTCPHCGHRCSRNAAAQDFHRLWRWLCPRCENPMFPAEASA